MGARPEFPVLNYNHVYYFHVAASEGSVARAAEHLGVTQPTVSEQIRQLEKTLGLTLFERTATGLRLTPAGRLAYQHTTDMFRAGHRLVECLGKKADDLPCTLRVGITPAVSRTIATDFLMPVFRIEECTPAIHTGELNELLRSLRGREIDLAIAEAEPGLPAGRGLEVVALHRPRLVVVAPPGLELDPDWGDAPMVHYGASSAYRYEVDDWLVDHGKRPRVVAEADDALLMLEAAARGAGIAFVSRSIARDAIASGRVQLLATLEPGPTAVHAIYDGREAEALARRTVERLVEHARQLEA